MNTLKSQKPGIQTIKTQMPTLFSPQDYTKTPFKDLPPPQFYPSFTPSIPKPKVNHLVNSVEFVENNFLENEFIEDPISYSQSFTAAIKNVSDNVDSIYVSHAQSFRSIMQVLNEGSLKHLPFSLGPYDSKTDVLDTEGENDQVSSSASSSLSSSTIHSQNDDVTVQISELKEIEESGKLIPMVEVELGTSTNLPSSSSSKNAAQINVSHVVLRRDRNKERKTEIDNFTEEEEFEKERDQKKKEKEKEKLKSDLENNSAVSALPLYYASLIEEKEKSRAAANPSPHYPPFIPSSFRTLQYLQYAHFALMSPQEIFHQIEENNKVKIKEISSAL